MYKLTQQKNNNIIGYLAIVAIATFVGTFFLTQVVLAVYDKAFGLEVADDTAAAYSNVMALTVNATNQTEGTATDMYMTSVKGPICDTLKPNQTAVQECLNI